MHAGVLPDGDGLEPALAALKSDEAAGLPTLGLSRRTHVDEAAWAEALVLRFFAFNVCVIIDIERNASRFLANVAPT